MRYTVKAASMATGVSESRLRTWERRYGIPRPGRSATGRRLYDEDDLAMIRRMAGLVSAGIPPSEAAQAAQVEGSLPVQPTAPFAGEGHPLVATIRNASTEYDEAATTLAIHDAVSSLGWAAALDQVLMPALREIGLSWEQNAVVSSNEHFTSEIIRREMAVALVGLEVKAGAPSVLLACPEDERHELGLLAIALLLRSRKLRTVYLGADVPTSDLVNAIQRVRPAVVCLSATTGSGLATLGHVVRALIGARIPTQVFVGGPAFRGGGDDIIPGVVLPYSVDAAAELIATAAGRDRRDEPTVDS